MNGIDEYTMGLLRMAVQNLGIQFNDPYGGWRLQSAVPLEDRNENHYYPVYRVQIVLKEHIMFEGIAIIFSVHVIEIMLNSRAIYTLMQMYVDSQLEKYTREHPWIVGV